MERGIRGSERRNNGGILSLTTLINEHGGALEYDLLVNTPYTLDDIGGKLPWRALSNFVRHAGYDSALYREAHKDDQMRLWLDGSMTALILADLFDLENIRAHAGTGKKPKPYPRPWRHEKRTRHIGKDPIRAGDFAAWWAKKG